MKLILGSLAILASALLAQEEPPKARWSESEVTFSSSPLNAALDIQFVPVLYPQYQWATGTTSQATGQGFHLAVEWLPLNEKYGKLGVGAGTGFNLIRDASIQGQEASMGTIPFEAFVSYRADYLPYQILVPFIKAGFDLTWVGQRGSIEVPGLQPYWGFDYGGGLEMCLSGLDKSTARVADTSLGINSVYLLFEYVRSEYLGTRVGPNLSRHEYRLGLRFEI